MPNSSSLGLAHRAAPVLRPPAPPAACRGCRRRARTTSATSSRSTAGANGRNDSRNLTLRLSIFCIVGDRGVAQDGAGAERARPELHAPLEPAERLPCGERRRLRSISCRVVEHVELRAGRRSRALDLRLARTPDRGRQPRMPSRGRCARARWPSIQMVGAQRRAERAAGVARRRLDPDAARNGRRAGACRWRRS